MMHFSNCYEVLWENFTGVTIISMCIGYLHSTNSHIYFFIFIHAHFEQLF